MENKLIVPVFILLMTLHTNSYAGKVFSKDWFWQIEDGELLFAATKNNSGHILGHYCSTGLEECFYLVAMDHECLIKGQTFSAKANSDLGDMRIQLVCMGQSEKKWVFLVNPFKEFDKIIQKARYINLSITEKSEQSKQSNQSKFSLTGSSSAINSMKLEAKIANKDIVLSHYQVKIQVYHELIICNVTFTNTPKSSREAELIVRKALETQVAIFPEHEIMAMAFDSEGQSMPDRHYGGVLIYDPKKRKIMTDDQKRGLKTIGIQRNEYFIQIREGKTAKGITPEHQWLTLSLVYPSEPDKEQIKNAVAMEIEELKQKETDISVYIYQGEQKNKITWEQILAPNGKYMNIEYTAKSGQIEPSWEWN